MSLERFQKLIFFYLSNQNVKRNADGLLAKQVQNNDSLLWPSGKLVPSDKFALS